MDLEKMNSTEQQDNPPSPFFLNRGVKQCKSEALKNRLRALIYSKGLSESDFYNQIGLSRQHWYAISWGLFECPIELKVKISSALGVDSCVIWEDSK